MAAVLLRGRALIVNLTVPYRQMLAWMRSFGELQRIGVESTGS
jgi:hypothetical protein